MSNFKDVLCLLAIFVAYGITGHMDYEDAVMLEEAQRPLRPSTSTECWPAIPSPVGKPATQVRHLGPEPPQDIPSDPASDAPPDANEPCPPIIY